MLGDLQIGGVEILRTVGEEVEPGHDADTPDATKPVGLQHGSDFLEESPGGLPAGNIGRLGLFSCDQELSRLGQASANEGSEEGETGSDKVERSPGVRGFGNDTLGISICRRAVWRDRLTKLMTAARR